MTLDEFVNIVLPDGTEMVEDNFIPCNTTAHADRWFRDNVHPLIIEIRFDDPDAEFVVVLQQAGAHYKDVPIDIEPFNTFEELCEHMRVVCAVLR